MPRTTEADLKNDRRSLNRKLSEHLFLLVKFGKTGKWGFLQDIRNQVKPEKERMYRNVVLKSAPNSVTRMLVEETMAGAAHRKIRNMFNKETLRGIFSGRVPVGYHVYKHDSSSPFYGTKVFIYRAQVLTGTMIDLGENSAKAKELDVVDYVWITRSELPEYDLEWSPKDSEKKFTPVEYLQDIFTA